MKMAIRMGRKLLGSSLCVATEKGMMKAVSWYKAACECWCLVNNNERECNAIVDLVENKIKYFHASHLVLYMT